MSVSRFLAILPSRSATPVVAGFVLVLFVIVGAFGVHFVPHDPTQADLSQTLLPPAFVAGGEWAHPLGTDFLGRDILSRLIVGARVALIVAVAVVVVSGAFGVMVAMLAGTFGGWLDAVLMRITDTALAFPYMLLAIVIVATFGASTQNVVIVLAVAGWPGYARIIRSEVLRLKQREFVTMVTLMGGGWLWTIARHYVPNVTHSFLVLATLQIGIAVIGEGSLSFLGLGVPPPAASWGGMLAEGRNYLSTAWWLPIFPGIALSVVVLSSNMVGDWLQVRHDARRGR